MDGWLRFGRHGFDSMHDLGFIFSPPHADDVWGPPAQLLLCALLLSSLLGLSVVWEWLIGRENFVAFSHRKIFKYCAWSVYLNVLTHLHNVAPVFFYNFLKPYKSKRRMLWSDRDWVTGRWKKLHNELFNLHSLPVRCSRLHLLKMKYQLKGS
jgi:hypothetical protein